jgi:putative membrane protein
MHVGKSYKLTDFLFWTRRKLYVLIILGVIPVLLYHVAGLKWLALPWTVVSLLGTATAFIVGFKNTQTYNRTGGAQVVWTNIVSGSKYWCLLCRDFLNDANATRILVDRHFAWLTALRFQMREDRVWEVTDKSHNAEYQRYYSIPERRTTLDAELIKYLPEEELAAISGTQNKATQILALQSRHIKEIYDSQGILAPLYLEMQKTVNIFISQQAQCESTKDAPYPRQYSIINTIFVWSFCLLLPFGMLDAFDKLDNVVTGIMQGHMIWLVVPFSVLVSWMYTSLEQVGESTENPYEGSPNDVPISQLCRAIEVDMREMLGDKVLPPVLTPENDILI